MLWTEITLAGAQASAGPTAEAPLSTDAYYALLAEMGLPDSDDSADDGPADPAAELWMLTADEGLGG